MAACRKPCEFSADREPVGAATEIAVDAYRSAFYTTSLFKEGFPSGQRDQTVNLTAQPSEVRILPPPPDCRPRRCRCGWAFRAGRANRA